MNKQLTIREYKETAKRYFKKASFFERIGATVEGIKPAEILMIGESEFHELYPKYFRDNRLTPMVTIKKLYGKRQVLVYHYDCLAGALNKRGVKYFLSTTGYPRAATLECCIEHLARRLRHRSFPHEIGVFLGYPLKDVFGYIGLNSLPHTKTKGWCMYGDTGDSEKLHEKYRCARERAGKKHARRTDKYNDEAKFN